jgi:serine/threonine protein kinase
VWRVRHSVLELFPPPAHRLEPMNRSSCSRSCNSLVINTGSTSEETEQGAAVGAEFAMMAIPTSRERAGRPSKEEFPVSLSDAAASLEVAGRHAEPHAIRIARLLYEEEILPTDLEGLEEHTANLLGSGGFGSVRKLFWRGTPVAAKVSHGDISETQKQLFLRELELMVRCRHPNIVQFLGFVDTPFMIVMEFLPMGDLKMYWSQRRGMSKGHKVTVCIDVCRALAYLHNRRPSAIIHRDIKPTNVLMTRSGVAKLTDFGLSRIVGADSKLGTPSGSKDGSKHGSKHGDSKPQSKHGGSAFAHLRRASAELMGTSPPQFGSSRHNGDAFSCFSPSPSRHNGNAFASGAPFANAQGLGLCASPSGSKHNGNAYAAAGCLSSCALSSSSSPSQPPALQACWSPTSSASGAGGAGAELFGSQLPSPVVGPSATPTCGNPGNPPGNPVGNPVGKPVGNLPGTSLLPSSFGNPSAAAGVTLMRVPVAVSEEGPQPSQEIVPQEIVPPPPPPQQLQLQQLQQFIPLSEIDIAMEAAAERGRRASGGGGGGSGSPKGGGGGGGGGGRAYLDGGGARFGADATAIVGTAQYMAPEAAGAGYDSKVDIYSAAVTFFELFESTEGPHAAWCAFNPRSGFLVLKTPAPIAALIKRMGDPDPKKRPTALEATRALEATGLARPAPEGGCCALS